jgi:hypothetical protein
MIKFIMYANNKIVWLNLPCLFLEKHLRDYDLEFHLKILDYILKVKGFSKQIYTEIINL